LTCTINDAIMNHNDSIMTHRGAALKQITIRGIPADVEKVVKKEAVRKKTSLNKAVVSLLEKAAGISEPEKKKQALHYDLDHLAGSWAKEEATEFDSALDVQRKIDEELWKKTE
jgi:hypothetical protein